MKERKEKPDDHDKVIKCIKLIQELIEMNDETSRTDHTLWIAAMMSIVFDGFANSQAPAKIFHEYLNNYISRYSETSKEWETQ